MSLLVAVLIGVRIGSAPLTYQDMITGLAAVAVVIILIQKRGLEIGFFIWILAFSLGYRTVRVSAPLIVDQLANGGQLSQDYLSTGQTPNIVLHPLFLVIFLLLGLILLQRAVNWQVRIVWLIPIPVIVFSFFWIWGWVRGTEAGTNWVLMFYDIVPFLMIAPIFIVTASLLSKRSLWKPAFLYFFLSGTIIALIGFLEVMFPSITHIIPGFSTADQSFYVAQDGFQRATFTFWGHPGAAFIVAITMPAIIPLWSWYKQSGRRVILLACLIMSATGVYIAGWRSLWLSMLLVTVGLLLLRGNWMRALFLVLALAVIYTFLPAQTQKRAESLFSAFQGNYEDHSAAERAGRSQIAISQILDEPLGLGWAGAGWVHDDFLQITANLGIIAGILFVLWYLTTLIRISRAFYEVPDPSKLALVGMFMIGGLLLLTQPMIVLPQYVTPIWFAWALVETKLRQVAEQKVDYGTNKANGAYSNLQLSNSPARMPGIR